MSAKSNDSSSLVRLVVIAVVVMVGLSRLSHNNTPSAGANQTHRVEANTVATAPPAPAGSAQALAQQILSTDSITYNDAETRNSFEQVASGQPATTTCDSAPVASVEVSPKLLRVILAISAQGIPLEFNALVDACHTESSFHYRGLGVDIINARQVGEQVMTYVSNNRVALDVNELFYNPYRELALDNGRPCNCVIANHDEHIHIGVNP